MATVLTNVGEQYVCDFLSAVTALTPQYVGWGTGADTADKTDTTLSTESAETRIAGTLTTQGTGASAKFQCVATITSLSGQTITNAGLLDAVTSGKLIIFGDFGGIVLATDDSIEFTITLDPA